MTPYERIDELERLVRELTARVERVEKTQQQGAVYAASDKAVPGATLHLPKRQH